MLDHLAESRSSDHLLREPEAYTAARFFPVLPFPIQSPGNALSPGYLCDPTASAHSRSLWRQMSVRQRLHPEQAKESISVPQYLSPGICKPEVRTGTDVYRFLPA